MYVSNASVEFKPSVSWANGHLAFSTWRHACGGGHRCWSHFRFSTRQHRCARAHRVTFQSRTYRRAAPALPPLISTQMIASFRIIYAVHKYFYCHSGFSAVSSAMLSVPSRVFVDCIGNISLMTSWVRNSRPPHVPDVKLKDVMWRQGVRHETFKFSLVSLETNEQISTLPINLYRVASLKLSSERNDSTEGSVYTIYYTMTQRSL